LFKNLTDLEPKPWYRGGESSGDYIARALQKAMSMGKLKEFGEILRK